MITFTAVMMPRNSPIRTRIPSFLISLAVLPLRGKTAREIRKLGEEEWKRVHEYGKR